MAYADLEREVARRRARSGDIGPAKTETPQPALENVSVESTEATCVRCGEPFTASCLRDGLKTILKQRHCSPCSEILAAEQSEADAKEQREARRAAWDLRLADLPKYREPFDSQAAIKGSLDLWDRAQTAMGAYPSAADRERQSEILWNRLESAIARVDAWTPNRKGIGFAGESGHAKTRLMFTLLHRLFLAGMSVEFITATAFGDEASARFSQDSGDAKRWIERLARVDVFFYDDMGKEALTERVAKELFNLIDKRASARRPIFATANFTGDQLAKHYEARSPMIGEPIVNRLRDCCEFIPV